MRVLLNGIGCPLSGGRAVLQQLLYNVPPNIKVYAILPFVRGLGNFNIPDNIHPLYFNHNIWGMYLRPFLEIAVNLGLILRKYNSIINISNYGLCFTNRQLLYIHNPFILDLNAHRHFGGGNPNVLNRFGLNTFLKKANCIILQTDHMYNNLKRYCNYCNISFPSNVRVLKPLPILLNKFPPINKEFEFQFFYPSSDFPHKRTELAISSILRARKSDLSIGLGITTLNNRKVDGIRFVGSIQHRIVFSWLNESDALLFTSERETLGLPLLEALNFELPAVLPDLPYAKEIYGDAAVYFHGEQIETVSEAIIRLKNNYEFYKNKVVERKKVDWTTRKKWDEIWKYFIFRNKNKNY